MLRWVFSDLHLTFSVLGVGSMTPFLGSLKHVKNPGSSRTLAAVVPCSPVAGLGGMPCSCMAVDRVVFSNELDKDLIGMVWMGIILSLAGIRDPMTCRRSHPALTFYDFMISALIGSRQHQCLWSLSDVQTLDRIFWDRKVRQVKELGLGAHKTPDFWLSWMWWVAQ